MAGMTPAIAALIRERRFGVAGTYGLTVAENLCMLAYPTLTGRAVDQLLQRRRLARLRDSGRTSAVSPTVAPR